MDKANHSGTADYYTGDRFCRFPDALYENKYAGSIKCGLYPYCACKGTFREKGYLSPCVPQYPDSLVTVVGGSLPGLFSGALITETLFAIPGIGYTSYQAMVSGDIPFSMFYMTFWQS